MAQSKSLLRQNADLTARNQELEVQTQELQRHITELWEQNDALTASLSEVRADLEYTAQHEQLLLRNWHNLSFCANQVCRAFAAGEAMAPQVEQLRALRERWNAECTVRSAAYGDTLAEAR